MFCNTGRDNLLQVPIHEFLTFFTGLYHQGNHQYSARNIACSAVFTILTDGKAAGQHPLTRRFVRHFNQKQALPCCSAVWDLNDLISHLRALAPVSKLLSQLLKHDYNTDLMK